MKARSDTERILDAYLAPDADRLADRVIDAALADIARTPQRRSWWPAWRSNDMNSYAKLIAAAAAVLVVAIVGYQFLAPNGGIGGGPTAQPSPTATSSPTAAAIPSLPDGPLAAGTYRLRPFPPSTLTIDLTVTAAGWSGDLAGPGGGNGPNGIFVIFTRAQTIHSDPCHWDQNGDGAAPDVGDIQVGPTVDDLADALTARSTYESTTPVDVTVGGFSGKRLELRLTPDPAGCDTSEGEADQFFVFGGLDPQPYAQGGANRWQLTILDVAGTRLIVAVVSYEDTPAADLSAAQGILDSVVITP